MGTFTCTLNAFVRGCPAGKPFVSLPNRVLFLATNIDRVSETSAVPYWSLNGSVSTQRVEGAIRVFGTHAYCANVSLKIGPFSRSRLQSLVKTGRISRHPVIRIRYDNAVYISANHCQSRYEHLHFYFAKTEKMHFPTHTNNRMRYSERVGVWVYQVI